MKTICCAVLLALSCVAFAADGDWPQWRGPARNGATSGGPALATTWPKDGPAKLWQSEAIPCEGTGGFASPIVADGKAYLLVAWKRQVPIATRKLSAQALGQLGWPGKQVPADMLALIEEARVSPERKAATKPDGFIKEWIAKNLTPAQQKEWGGWATERLKQADKACPMEVLDRVAQIKDKEFGSQEDLDKALDGMDLSAGMRQAVIRLVATKADQCTDTVICIDATSGKTLWKKEYPGKVSDWGVSDSMAIEAGKCIAIGTNGTYCLNAATGEELWKSPKGGSSSSVLVTGGVVVAQMEGLTAFDLEKGGVLWTAKLPTGNNSPAAWRSGEKTLIICNTEGGAQVFDLKTGAAPKFAWNAPATAPATQASAEPVTRPAGKIPVGGGHSSPAIDEGRLLIMSNQKPAGLAAYELSADAGKGLWARSMMDNGCSPILYQGRAFAHVGGRIYCYDAKSGQLIWTGACAGPDWNSPIIAGGRLFVFSGSDIVMLDPMAEQFTVMAKAKAGPNRCISPTVADGKLFVRTGGGIVCYDLTGKVPATAASN